MANQSEQSEGAKMNAGSFMSLVFLLTLTLAVPGGARQDQPVPHELAYCTNHAAETDFPMEEPHICSADCRRSCGEGENRGCATYCRADHCHCLAECDAGARDER